MNSSLLHRLQKLSLKDFRAFGGADQPPVDLTLDADLVLIFGTNGSGKTSVVHALNLALNGGSRRIRNSGRIATVREPYVARQALIGCDWKQSDGNAKKTLIDLAADPTASDWQALHKQLGVIDPDLGDWSSIFYQDHLELSLASFERFLRATSQEHDHALDAIKRGVPRLQTAINAWEVPGIDNGQEVTEALWRAADGLWNALNDFAQLHAPTIGHPPELAAEQQLINGWEKKLAAYVARLAKAIGISDLTIAHEPTTALLEAIQMLGRRSATPGSAMELPKIIEALRSLPPERILKFADRQFSADLPTSANVDGNLSSNPFTQIAASLPVDPLGNPAGPDLATVLEALAARSTTWNQTLSLLTQAGHSVAPPVLAEWLNAGAKLLSEPDLRRRLRATASQLAAAANATGIAERRSAGERDLLGWLNSQMADAPKSLLKRFASFPDQSAAAWVQELSKTAPTATDDPALRLTNAAGTLLTALARVQRRQEALNSDPAFAKAREQLTTAQTLLSNEAAGRGALARAVRPDHTRVQRFTDAVNRALAPFQLSRDFLPLRIDTDAAGGGELRTATGLRLSELSAGQRAQLNLSWCVAVNQLMANVLRHRVVVFDDVGPVLDRAQLAPACLLFRQLAYGKDADARRQVILTCHDEAIAGQLIDRLQPPPGATMAVLDLPALDHGRASTPRYHKSTGEAANATTAELSAQLGPLVKRFLGVS